MKKAVTANGKQINLDALIAAQGDSIAVGNMKVNARGDQLGPGGKVEIPKDKVMANYYKLNTPVAVNNPAQARTKETQKDLSDEWIEPVTSAQPEKSKKEEKLRGSLADAISKNKPASSQEPEEPTPTRI